MIWAVWNSSLRSNSRIEDHGIDLIRIKRFDKAWKRACKELKIGIRIFHDFRRAAVRNMVRSGVPERATIMISAHKTRPEFDRYIIVSDEDLRFAIQKVG